MQDDLPPNVHTFDAERTEIDAACGRRQLKAPLPVEPEIERKSIQRQFTGAPFPAHQRSKAELNIKLVGAHPRRTLFADGNAIQPQRGRRQQQRVDLTVDPYRRAEDAGRLRLELGPELVPVDEIRPDQRRDQRKDESNSQSEQCGLQGLSSVESADL